MKNTYFPCSGSFGSLLLAGTLLPLFCPSLAAADSANTFLQWMSNPDVSVASDGTRYTTLVPPGAPLQGAFIVQIDAGISGRVKSWKSWPSLALEPDNPSHPGAWLVFENDGDSASYSRPRPKSVNTAAPFFLDSNSYASLAVEACNAEATRLSGQGLDDSAIFAQNREAKIAVRGNLDYSTTGITGTQTPEEVDSWNAFKAITVICLKRDDSLDPVVQTIEDATLTAQTAQISNITGACEMTLSGQITSAEPNRQVKFRYHDNSGQQSDEKTIVTNGSGHSSFEHSYPVSADTADGKVRMIGSSPAFMSNWASYEVNCSAAPDELITQLPPKASLVVAVQEEAPHRGMACPVTLNLIGKLEGRGKSSGAAAILSAGQIKALKAYNIDKDEKVFFQGPHSLSWDGLAFLQQSVTFRLNVTNASGDVVDSVEKTRAFTCRPITASPLAGGAADGFAPATPTRQKLTPLPSLRPSLRTAPLPQGEEEARPPARLKQRNAP
ncbi:hypothetical protein [Kiloniella laminariae]|uniref:hypothetical protein n=1 Tax=Kiloniella laminariae TaxID=454162 RepID=UPI00035E3D75|nr:hypothetical protein [Kiloniella laminariae]